SSANMIKYIDFGLSCMQTCTHPRCRNRCVHTPGTPKYTPPFYYGPPNPLVPPQNLIGSQAHDIWALGFTMWELVNARDYFPINLLRADGAYLDMRDALANINRGPIRGSKYLFDFPDNRINAFIDHLLIVDWRQRPTIDA